MKIFYYVHTGHRIGLDRFRRACSIIRALENVDITLLCSDFRIAHEARKFGVQKSVGVDLVQNIPKIAERGDAMIFDSDEASPIMLEDMRDYFSTFIRVSDTPDDEKAANEFLISPYLSGDGICNTIIVDDKYFRAKDKQKTIKLAYFFGDDDYEKDLEKSLSFIEELNPDLQLGFYYFLDYEDMLRDKFKNHHEFEDYDEVIQNSEILVTASAQAALENLASGGKPIYIQRDNYSSNLQKLFNELNIPMIRDDNYEQLINIISQIDNHNYYKMKQNSDKLALFIKETLNL